MILATLIKFFQVGIAPSFEEILKVEHTYSAITVLNELHRNRDLLQTIDGYRLRPDNLSVQRAYQQATGRVDADVEFYDKLKKVWHSTVG